MKNQIQDNRRISFLNLCKNTHKDLVDQIVLDFFESQNISVLNYLKEINPYVVIVTEYPIHVDELLKILDPYRKYCEEVIMIVITENNFVESDFTTKLTQYGINNIVFVENTLQINGQLNHHFNRWVTIKNAVNDVFSKKPSNKNYSYREDEYIGLAFSFC
jgi:hypothetical protein